MSPHATARGEPLREVDEPKEAQDTRVVRSEELFGTARTVLIRHADAVYTLRRTSTGKLILTK